MVGEKRAMKSYYTDRYVTIYLGDCREVLPQLDVKVDLVLTDPPYGIGKASWDDKFNIDALVIASPLTNKLGLMCGNWNILDCPKEIGHLLYKWTLSAHLINGMTRGGFGFGNWIPCITYTEKVYREDAYRWCCCFTDWCEKNRVTKNDLNRVTGTSDMGGWWMSRLLHRCNVPSYEQWQKIKMAFNTPAEFDSLIPLSCYEPISDCKDFVVGQERKPNHPSPKPEQPIMWFIDSLSKESNLILDPFLGSGTTCYCAKKLNRYSIGIEIEEKYCEIAANRCRQEVFDLSEVKHDDTR